MKNTKHTPGPWIADGNGFEHTWDVSNKDGSISTVKTSRKDADLIAAAPELLEALSEAWGYVLYYAMDPNTADKDANSVLQKMDSAIRKARGGAE